MRARMQTAALAALLALPATAQAQVIAITGGTVHPVSGAKIERGTVLIRDGKIAEVGANVAVPAGARVIDATGKIVTPGLINANTQLGLSEGGGPQFSGGYNDTRAKGTRGVAAAFRAWEGFNPASTFITPARQGGVTTVMIAPGGGMIGGQSALLNLGGDRLEDMLVRRASGGPAVAMSASFSPGAADAASRGELLGRLREVLQDAKAYGANRAAFERNATRSFAAPRADLEALQSVIDTTLPLVVEVDRASDIRAVLDLKRRDKLPLRLILLGVAEGWQVAADIAAAKVPVMVGAMSNIPGSFDVLGARQENAALLRAAGISVVLISNGSDDAQNFNVQNIRYEAGNAVAYGLSWDEAMRAVTLAPAEAFGVADRIGSLRPGRDANIVIWDGDPFEFATKAETVMIRGAVQTGASRQDELTRRYAPVKGRP
ncbi:MAG: amidohydrolase family protein [Gemmatimonadaceae bacterium]|nr:amidohydrolase family protein [Gemmatimonadaceae bacterium]